MPSEIVKKNPKAALAERFADKVIACYGDVSSKDDITERERGLIAGYFESVDVALNKQGITWKDLDDQKLLDGLALSMASKARLGLDMRIPNHLNIVPSRNKHTGKITIKYITGYKGEVHMAKKFAVTPPLDIVPMMVYETDKFEPVFSPDGDSYTLTVGDPFNRGKIVGGFAYIKYDDSRLNRLFVMSLKEILSHKPSYIKDGDEFWAKYPVQMYEKTLVRYACRSFDLDVSKIDQFREAVDFEEQEQLQQAKEDSDAIAEESTAQGNPLDVSYSVVPETGEVIEDGVSL